MTVERYIRTCRNPLKRAYAQAYAEYLARGGAEPPRPEGLGYMGAQAVRLSLTDIARAQATNREGTS